MPKPISSRADLDLLESFWRELVHRTVLPNGLTVLLKPDSSAAVASVQVWVKSGSVHEGAQLGAGLSHYLEHLLFKGTAQRAGRDISNLVQAHGGDINAYTSFDRTVYHIDVPSESVDMAIELLADIIEARDAYTHEHTGRVRRFALLLGECLGWSERQLEVLGLVALLHDIGKIAIPDAILRKAGPLTAEEATVMGLQPVLGYDILQRVPYLAGAASGVRGHHERWDGQGYPDKLAGDNIPLEARIVTIADTFDAITTDRPYRQARSVELALAELERESGRQFDPALVALFTQHTERVAELAGLSPL